MTPFVIDPSGRDVLGAAERIRALGLVARVEATRDGTSPLSEEELVDSLALFVSAGHEATVNLLGNAIVAMLTHPDQLGRARGGDDTWDDVLEETLRNQAPVPNLPPRFAVEDRALPARLTP